MAQTSTSSIKLAKSNSLQSFMDFVGMPVFALDSSGTVISANNLAAELLGQEQSGLLAQNLREILSIERLKKANRKENENLEMFPYRAKIVTQGRKEIIGFSAQRIWEGQQRLLIITLMRIDWLLEERRNVKKLHENLELKARMRTIALANRVRELDAAKKQLSETLKDLQNAQSSLIQSEKMASLGGLVAGVAHEINTPLGNSVTASSFLQDAVQKFQSEYEQGDVTREGLEEFLQAAEEAGAIIDQNLKRAAELVRSFKQVAVDQTIDELRNIKVKGYLDELLLSLKPQLKNGQYKIHLTCPEGLEISTYPGSLGQIVTNLVTNAVAHGFEGRSTGEIWLDIQPDDEKQIHLHFRDNGKGIPQDMVKSVFDPFVTTKRGQGGTGLGLHILHNLVSQKFDGTVSCDSVENSGTTFEISWPLH